MLDGSGRLLEKELKQRRLRDADSRRKKNIIYCGVFWRQFIDYKVVV